MLEFLAAAAPYLIVAGASGFICAAFGYFTGYADAMRAPRYRRRNADVASRP